MLKLPPSDFSRGFCDPKSGSLFFDSASFLLPNKLAPLVSAYEPELNAGVLPAFSSSVFDTTDRLDSLIIPSVSVFPSSCLDGNRGDGVF